MWFAARQQRFQFVGYELGVAGFLAGGLLVVMLSTPLQSSQPLAPLSQLIISRLVQKLYRAMFRVS